MAKCVNGVIWRGIMVKIGHFRIRVCGLREGHVLGSLREGRRETRALKVPLQEKSLKSHSKVDF